jgi:uncharacterized membrane protein
MYKIIGADQREYGPVSAEQIHQWIAEGRANGATSVQPEGAAEWVPLSSLPEFAEALTAQAPRFAATPQPPTTDPTALAEIARQRRASLDLGLCVSRSWNLFKKNAGLLIAATVIFLVLVMGLNQVVALFTRNTMQSVMAGNLSPGAVLVLLVANLPDMALSALLTGGIYTILLKLVRGQPTGIGDLFAGFGGSAAQLVLAGIIVHLLVGLGLLLCIVPGIYLSTAWIFTVPLIVDRQLDFWSAMEVSRKGVNPHWWSVFCLLIVVALISIVGFLACCIGFLAALPIGLGALIYAYEDLFGGSGPAAS